MHASFDFSLKQTILAQISGMKKSVLSIIVILCCGFIFSGCIKKRTDRTVNPSMTSSVGTYTFTADLIQPSVLKPQLNDSAISLIITGYEKSTGNKVVISVRKYLGKAGTFSIVQGEAGGEYAHGGTTEIATSGIVAIKEVDASTITGYFSFATALGTSMTNGSYVTAKPWDY